jgi:hypothetical protein
VVLDERIDTGRGSMRTVAFVMSLLLASAASAGPDRVDAGLLEGTSEGLKILDEYFAWRRQ